MDPPPHVGHFDVGRGELAFPRPLLFVAPCCGVSGQPAHERQDPPASDPASLDAEVLLVEVLKVSLDELPPFG